MSGQGPYMNTKTQRFYPEITPSNDFVGPDIFSKPRVVPPPMGPPQPANVTKVNQRFKKDNPMGDWRYK